VFHGGKLVESDGVGFLTFSGSCVMGGNELSVLAEDGIPSGFFLSGWELEAVGLFPGEPFKVGNWGTREG